MEMAALAIEYKFLSFHYGQAKEWEPCKSIDQSLKLGAGTLPEPFNIVRRHMLPLIRNQRNLLFQRLWRTVVISSHAKLTSVV